MCQKAARKFPASNMNLSVRNVFAVFFEGIIFDNENREIDDDADDYSDDDSCNVRCCF